MGRIYLRGCSKFYDEQLKLLEIKLRNFFDNSEIKMTKERYLMMCEQLGNEPLAEEIPPEYDDFPYSVQLSINIYSILSDKWEGFSGTYMGKDYTLLPYLVKLYNIENEAQVLQFLLLIDRIVSEKRAEEQKRKRKKSTSKKGGTHIKG